MLVDGDQNVRLPSTASTAANGSDGPVNPAPRSCQVQPTWLHSSPTVVLSGSRPPPVRAGLSATWENIRAPMPSAISTTHAPPPEKKPGRSVRRSGWPERAWARRSLSCVAVRRSGAIASQPTRRLARRVRRAAGTVPSNAARRPEASSPPIQPGRLARRCPIERSTASGTSESQWMTTAAPGA